jgi:protein-tyrosine phosphatase
MAEILARLRAEEAGYAGLGVRSAGTAAGDGSGASEMAIRVAGSRGLDLSEHRSTALTPEQIARADLVITMTRRHAEVVASLVPDAPVILATEFLSPGHPLHGRDVPDPFGSGVEMYEATWEALEECVDGFFGELERGPDAQPSSGTPGS